MAFKGEANPNGGCNGLFDSLDERPPVHFFRIILPCILDEKKLRIPNMFVRRYGEELSGAAKVIAPSGHAWHIGLTKDQSNIWFDEGWQKFVDHHSIRYGYLLLFAYRGCCNFSVLIFDMSACEIPYPRVGSTSAKNANYDLNVFGSEGKSSKRQNASAEQNLGMKRHRGCNSVQKSQDLKQFGDKRSEEFVKEVDAEIIDLEENGRESGKEKLNYRRMYRTCRSVFNESNNRKDKNKSPSKGEDVGIVAGIPARAFTERTRVICPVKKLEPESPFKVTLDLKQFGDKRSEEFVKEVDAETSDLEENGRESGKEKLNHRHMYRTRRSSLNESNNEDKNKSASKSEDVRIVAGIPARAFTESRRVIRPVKKLEPESPSFKVTLQSYNIHKHLLYVPHGFARRHLLGGPAIIKLEVSNGRYWPVQILQHEHQLVTLTKGWSQFVGENDLVEGDVCTFEVLVKGNGSVLKVTVSRDGSRPLKS